MIVSTDLVSAGPTTPPEPLVDSMRGRTSSHLPTTLPRALYLALGLPLALAAAVVLALGLQPPPSRAATRAQSLNRAGLVVRFGDGSTITRCVTFSEPEISGLDVLARSDLVVVAAGSAICDIEGESGCPVEACFCQCPGGGSSCLYWTYWHLVDEGWAYATAGSGGYQVHDGDVEGWAWGSEGPPPVVSFAEICASPAHADVWVAKTGRPGTVFAGELLTYTITVSNAGPYEAQNVVVSDTLPAEVALVDTTPPPHGGAGQPGSLTWGWGTLALQEQAMLTIVVQVHPWVTTPFTNSVRVSSTSDATPGNNSATETTVLKFPYSFYLPVTCRRKTLQ